MDSRESRESQEGGANRVQRVVVSKQKTPAQGWRFRAISAEARNHGWRFDSKSSGQVVKSCTPVSGQQGADIGIDQNN